MIQSIRSFDSVNLVTTHYTWNAHNYTSFSTTVLLFGVPWLSQHATLHLQLTDVTQKPGYKAPNYSFYPPWAYQLYHGKQITLWAHGLFPSFSHSLYRQMKKECFQVKIEEINTILSLHSSMHRVCVTVIQWFSQHATQDSPTVTHGMLTLCSYSHSY